MPPSAIRSWMTERAKTIGAFDALTRRNPLYYGVARACFDRLAAASLDERARWEAKRLEQILAVASRSAYGRAVRGGGELESWPILEKSTLREQPETLLAMPAWRTVTATTSGTTGSPVRLHRSFASIAAEQASYDRVLSLVWVGALYEARMAVLMDDVIKDPNDHRPPYWRRTNAGRRLMLSSRHISARTALAYADAIEAFAPDWMFALPPATEHLAMLLLREGRRVKIPVIVSTSEVLTPGARRVITDAFGCTVVDRYGGAERVACAYGVREEEYYFLPGYSRVELRHCLDDGPTALYEVIGTGLWNTAMPLVRYRTGDLVRLPAGLSVDDVEHVRLGGAPFLGIVGRTADYLWTPDGARLSNLGHVPTGVEHIVRLQLIQEELDRVRILVVPAKGFSLTDEARLLRNARTVMPGSMRLTVEVVDEVERTARGKTPYLIRRREPPPLV
jgi:phenylacetate-CoA ligase